MFFFLQADESRYIQLIEDLSKVDFLGRYEYPEIINGAYKLLVLTSRQFGGRILRGRRLNFRN